MGIWAASRGGAQKYAQSGMDDCSREGTAMGVTTGLVRHQRRVCELLDEMDADASVRDVRAIDLIDLACDQLAAEEGLLAVGVLGAIEAGRHRRAHVRARLALFGLVTADPARAAFRRHLRDLKGLLGARSAHLAAAVEWKLEGAGVLRSRPHVSSASFDRAPRRLRIGAPLAKGLPAHAHDAAGGSP
jgi:hypothetical protein